MPSARSISRLRSSLAWPDMNISATQVLLQSNFLPSGASSASRTAWRLAPQNVQNLISSVWFEEQRGHSISSSCSGNLYGYDNSTTPVLIRKPHPHITPIYKSNRCNLWIKNRVESQLMKPLPVKTIAHYRIV